MQSASHRKFSTCPVGYYHPFPSYHSRRLREIDKLAQLASRGDSGAESALRDKYLRLVVKISRQHCSTVYHVTVLDLIEAGFRGLNKAIKQFQTHKLLSFDVIVAETIRAEISQMMLKVTKSGCTR